MKSVRIGLIGAGFLARTRVRCYRQVAGYDVQLVAVAARSHASAQKFADAHGISQALGDYRALLAQPDIDMVDLCVPTTCTARCTEAAAQAGKQIVCTKPLTAYIGQGLAQDVPVAQMPRAEMLRVALEDADAMLDAAQRAGVQLMYGENWLYAPSISRAEGLIAQSGGAILELRGGECHSGSHSPFSRRWQHAGGGALIQLGAHPIGAMLHIKRREGIARNGQPIRAVAVSAEVGDTSRIAPPEKSWVATAGKTSKLGGADHHLRRRVARRRSRFRNGAWRHGKPA